jgi:hypothetical protein
MTEIKNDPVSQAMAIHIQLPAAEIQISKEALFSTDMSLLF